MRFKNKVAIVTGGASGIGEAVSVEAASEGARIAVIDRDEEGGKKVVARIKKEGGRAIALTCDLSKHEQIMQACEKTVEVFGGIDLLCYSAGVQTYGTVVSTDEELWEQTLDINLKGMYLIAKYCVPEMIKRGGGSIVNISSVQGFASQKNVAAYATSKGGAISLSRAMALDHASDNIRVNCVCPGSVDTPMLRYGAGEHGDADSVIKEWGMNHPVGRVGTPKEIARTVLFLWSEDAGFITAQPIIVDGGLISGIF